jgi:hypothetical protein
LQARELVVSVADGGGVGIGNRLQTVQRIVSVIRERAIVIRAGLAVTDGIIGEAHHGSAAPDVFQLADGIVVVSVSRNAPSGVGALRDISGGVIADSLEQGSTLLNIGSCCDHSIPNTLVASLLCGRNIINNDNYIIRLKCDPFTPKPALAMQGTVSHPTPVPTINI